MGLFDKNSRTGGFMDEIRCDEPNYLIWKWHPSGVQLGEGFRENAIRWGSSLRVKDGEVAVFVYKQKRRQNLTSLSFIKLSFYSRPLTSISTSSISDPRGSKQLSLHNHRPGSSSR